MDVKDEINKHENPRKKANPLSALTFTWLLSTFWIGFKRDLELSDLPKPLKEHKSSNVGNKLSKSWDRQYERFNNQNEGKNKKISPPSLFRSLVKVFGIESMSYGIILAIMEVPTKVLQPLAVGRLVRHFSKANEENKSTDMEAYLAAGVIILCSVVNMFAIHPYMMASTHVGMKIRVACCSLVYRKSLKLSRVALGEKSIGQVVNLLSNDVSRFDNAVVFLHYLWISLVETALVTYFMYLEVGWSAVIGMFSLLMFIPLQGWLGKTSSVLRMKTAIRTDERVRLISEIINGIQAIKMYTWEQPFSILMEKARKSEISIIRKMAFLQGILTSFMTIITRFSLFITVLAIIYLDKYYGNDNLEKNGITAEKVFMLTSFYTGIRQSMTVFFPLGIIMSAQAWISVKRIQEFLMYEEIDSKKFHKNSEDKDTNTGLITLENVHAKWLKNGSDDTLTNINMKVKPAQLVAIVGQVGSGKSSLLNVILRELETYHGSVDVHGNIAYVSQEPWLFAGSVRTNILFGKKMDEKRYEQVVKVCQLKRDFRLFPYGDKTLVGERGVSLSGGQRARINLARAVYADSPIYLFDDPLSAVDAHVGKHMFEECIERYLKGKTRILVTHQVQFLDNVEKIIVLKDGAIQAEGSYNELIAQGVDFGRLLEPPVEEDNEDDVTPNTAGFINSRQVSVRSTSSSISNKTINDSQPNEAAETRTRGNIGGQVYLKYLNAAGNCCGLFFVLFLFIGAQVLATGGDLFITWWVNLEEKYSNAGPGESRSLTTEDCVYIFAGIILCTVIGTFIRSIAYYMACMRASIHLHDRMFRSISRATMRFFNTNTSGRILNRFSKDMGSIDELLPMALFDCIQIGLSLIGIIGIAVSTEPFLVIPTLFIVILFYYMRNFYLPTSRSVKRLEGIARSPVYNHLNATLQGLATIRSSNASKLLIEEFDNHQDLHSSAWFIFISSSNAFGLWLDTFAVLYISLVTLSFLVIPGSDSKSGGNVGLAITQVIGLTGIFQWVMRQSAELENQMTSVERVYEYTILESESPLESLPGEELPPDWPTEGKIEFKNVYLSYGPDEAPVLKNLSFTINEREKIGIVGRTGAGKSSLISALFRFANLKGKIEIDGVETGEIGLRDLRSKISIIPQEPFLFSGTLRKNLDPFESFGDDVLWAALEDVELKDMGLTAHVNDGGSNLSVGERQLVCLARAIVRNNKILILDEATANVDSGTDELIQKTIRQKFANCTVLTIAHRLNTVMDSDKILVVDAGSVLEFDQPHLLLQNPDGALSSMVNETGKSMADSLIAIAKDNYKIHGLQESPTTSL
ncbi:probable multidrug resistance-associated protein lethal(2)03659 [Aphidius gifuensis]|uniref:probable multidrug resistance-associated protein lethal(2)03659 n=1 Tax=Aphidius gifuensis TaxID=684658 RepID=UPI001CDC1F81|nr:probable multidrug resistance-associated protein lethal(2)03659 [Aphidius gifuensis]